MGSTLRPRRGDGNRACVNIGVGIGAAQRADAHRTVERVDAVGIIRGIRRSAQCAETDISVRRGQLIAGAAQGTTDMDVAVHARLITAGGQHVAAPGNIAGDADITRHCIQCTESVSERTSYRNIIVRIQIIAITREISLDGHRTMVSLQLVAAAGGTADTALHQDVLIRGQGIAAACDIATDGDVRAFRIQRVTIAADATADFDKGCGIHILSSADDCAGQAH